MSPQTPEQEGATEVAHCFSEPELRRQYLASCQELKQVRANLHISHSYAAAVMWCWAILDSEMLRRRLYKTRLMLAGSLLEASA